MMALPASQLDTTYWLPWYNYVDPDTQLDIDEDTHTGWHEHPNLCTHRHANHTARLPERRVPVCLP